MGKMTLKFSNLLELATFANLLPTGYLLNTCNLTVTGYLDQEEVNIAINKSSAQLIETTEKVFTC